jgi:hypothetical protein
VQSTSDATLRERLLSLLVEARSSARQWLIERALPVVVQAECYVVLPTGNGWKTDSVIEDQNSLRRGLQPNMKLVTDEWVTAAFDLATVVESEYRDRMPGPAPLFTSFGHLTGESDRSKKQDDPVQHVLNRFVYAPTWWYLTHLTSVNEDDTTLAAEIVERTCEVLETGTLLVRQSILLDGLRPTELLSRDGIRIRTLSPRERGDLIAPDTIDGSFGTGRWGAIPPQHVLEVDTPWKDLRLFMTLPVPAILLAMELHGIRLSGPGEIRSHVEPEWFGVGMGGRPVQMRSGPQFGAQDIDGARFGAACDTALKLKNYHIEDPDRPSELALRRFSLGCGREDLVDSLLDFVISLEALLLPYDETARRSDMTYRFRMHGAHFIANEFERSTIYKQLGDLYDMRSRLVHGRGYPTRAEVDSATQNAQGFAARGLLKAMTEGFPDSVYFRRKLLGEV